MAPWPACIPRLFSDARFSIANGGQARQILNVKPKATDDEIREAATKLVAMNNPDKGGSRYLTYKINNAREMLVGQPPEELRRPPEADASSK